MRQHAPAFVVAGRPVPSEGQASVLKERDRGRAKPVPTALAALAFLPLAAILWWAMVGPRPQPALLDWDELGYEVTSTGAVTLAEVASADARDPALLSRDMAGLQRPLLGPLDDARHHADGALAALVREVAGTTDMTEAPGYTGVVVISEDGEVERCAFGEPVPVDVLEDAADSLDDEVEGDVRLAVAGATGRCTGEDAHLAVPLVRRVVRPLGALQRLAGQRAESALLPAGVLLARSADDLELVERYGDDAGAVLPVYPREVARQALVRAAPSNPNAELGPLGDPAYPVLARGGDALWWVMPVSPAGEGDAVAGFARTRADRMAVGELNEVRLEWLDVPLHGPALLERRALDTLRDAGELPPEALDQVRVRWTVPDAEGRWNGHVAHAGQVHYRMAASGAGEVCLEDLDGHQIGCRGGDR